MSSQQQHMDVLEEMPPRQRRVVCQREHCVRLRRWAILVAKDQGMKQSAAMPGLLAFLKSLGISVSASTLSSWERAFCHDGLLGLIDRRGMRGRLKECGRFFLELERICIGGLHSIEMCHELAKQRAVTEGWVIPVLRDSQNYLKKYILPGITAERGGMIEGHLNGVSIDI